MGIIDINTSVINKDSIQYLDITHRFNDYNEIDNLNTHLLSANNSESMKLSSMNDQLKTRAMKMKQDYMLTDYSINELAMYNNIIAFTIIVVCLLLFCVVKVGKKAMIWISVIIGIIYLIIIMVLLKMNSTRRKYSWSQWYWKPVENKN